MNESPVISYTGFSHMVQWEHSKILTDKTPIFLFFQAEPAKSVPTGKSFQKCSLWLKSLQEIFLQSCPVCPTQWIAQLLQGFLSSLDVKHLKSHVQTQTGVGGPPLFFQN